MPADEDTASIAELQADIDVILVSRGFAPGQGGADDGHSQIIWCAAALEFATRFPDLPTSHEPADGWGAMCTDFVVDLAVTDGDWRITGISVEGHDLDQTLAGLSRTAAAQRATDLLGASVREAVVSLHEVLKELMNSPATEL